MSLRLPTERTGLIKKHSCSVCPASERRPPPFFCCSALCSGQITVLQQGGLPVPLTGRDSSHTELHPHCPWPYLPLTLSFSSVFPSGISPTALLLLLCPQCGLQEQPKLCFCHNVVVEFILCFGFITLQGTKVIHSFPSFRYPQLF